MRGHGQPGDQFYACQRSYEALLLIWFLTCLAPMVVVGRVEAVLHAPPVLAWTVAVGLWVALPVAVVDLFRLRGIRVEAGGFRECRPLGTRRYVPWTEVTTAGLEDERYVGRVVITTARQRFTYTGRLCHRLRFLATVQARIGQGASSGTADRPERTTGYLLGKPDWSGPFRPVPAALLTELELTHDPNMDFGLGCFVAVPVMLLMGLGPPFVLFWYLVDRWRALWPGQLRADARGLSATHGRWGWSCRWSDIRHLEETVAGWRLSTTQGDLAWHHEPGEDRLIDALRAACAAQEALPLPPPRPAAAPDDVPNGAISLASADRAESGRGLSIAERATPPDR